MFIELEVDDRARAVTSAAGALKDPGWYFNLRAQPDVIIETASGEVEVRATELDGADYTAAWRRFTARSRAFQTYQDQAAGRRLPIFRFERVVPVEPGGK